MQLTEPFYYLKNFTEMLRTLVRRDEELLAAEERDFIDTFFTQAMPAKALLVRMAMRKGPYFLASRLKYAEIADLPAATAALAKLDWIDPSPALRLDELFRLLPTADLVTHLAVPRQLLKETKTVMLERLRPTHPGTRTFAEWCRSSDDIVYRFMAMSMCERLRLLFFGNFRQNLTDFVLADLGVFRFENIDQQEHSRPFRTRRHVEDFLRLHQCREWLQADVEPAIVEAAVPPAITDCEWLEERREKIRFQIARAHERAGAMHEALAIYSTCSYREAHLRGRRLDDRLSGRPRRRTQRQPSALPQFELTLRRPGATLSVERAVLEHLSTATEADTEVHYVENALINSLFGLLCWRAVFAPVPGAFFHAYHHGPADLASAGFHARRARQFAECFAELDGATYKQTMRAHFVAKAGISSPFVAWGLLDDALLDIALECFPARHLRRWFEWIVQDVKINRSGFPDLVQFWPGEGRYRLIEVKGPGDRLQDNQRRCLDYCVAHDIPVSVCHVRWLEGAAAIA